MRHFLNLLFLLLILSSPALAGNGSGNVSSVIGLGAFGTVSAPTASIPLSNPSGGSGQFAVFSIYAGNQDSNLSNANFYPFYKNGVQYQVTAGKVAYCFNFNFHGGSANALWQLVSSSATFAFNSVSITTTGMPAGFGSYQAGATQQSVFQGSTSNTTFQEGGMFNFGPATFPGIQNNTATVAYGVSGDCYEN